jgi:transcriptional regulator with XRE-family HTH domain
MAPDEQQFLKALGTRIAQLRKEQGLSQQSVADSLGVAQQTYAHYEVGRVRMSISLLPEVAQLFGVSTDDLLGLKSGAAGKRGPTPKLQQQIERLSHLPKAKRGRHGDDRRRAQSEQIASGHKLPASCREQRRRTLPAHSSS